MKRIIRLIALMTGQVVAVLVLARVARGVPMAFRWSIGYSAAVVYGVPAVLTFLGCRWLFHGIPGLQRRIPKLSAALLLSACGFGMAVSALQKTDRWLTDRYARRMQSELRADSRFKEVRLLGYSNDFILAPYIPVAGSVESDEDLGELNRILRESRSPAFVWAGSWLVRRTPKLE